jgi:hypothetical protein
MTRSPLSNGHRLMVRMLGHLFLSGAFSRHACPSFRHEPSVCSWPIALKNPSGNIFLEYPMGKRPVIAQ